MTVINEIIAERTLQDKMWGGSRHDDLHSFEDWCSYIYAYRKFAENKADSGDLAGYRRKMMQVAALAIAACESYDRKNGSWRD